MWGAVKGADDGTGAIGAGVLTDGSRHRQRGVWERRKWRFIVGMDFGGEQRGAAVLVRRYGNEVDRAESTTTLALTLRSGVIGQAAGACFGREAA